MVEKGSITEDSVSELEKRVESNPKNVEIWLSLIEEQLSAGINMREIGSTFLRAIKMNPSHDGLYSCAIQALEGFDLEDIITEIEDIRNSELNKPRGFL